ncbi:hypothetical protein [Sandaracinobacteroides hominis]|uniref:hypothetical protein n=1 Tax=Sandaracinobacteroides hominis TaxID=2780086 RepID=UPI0018F73859|nr:hypothetical protein [Sandaracinobacteroides hominis]
MEVAQPAGGMPPTAPNGMRHALLTIWAPAIASAIFAAIVTFFVTANLNNTAAIKQQYYVSLANFNDTGTKMDAVLSNYVDALLDGKLSAQNRNEVRQAITTHAAASAQLKGILEDRQIDNYQRALGILRSLFEQTTDISSAMRAGQAHIDLIEHRNKMHDAARDQIERI